MLETNFHPHAPAFWQPIGTATVAAILGGLLGMAIGYADGVREGLAGWAYLPAMLAAILAWLYDHAVWMEILRQSYAPPVLAPLALDVPEVEASEYPPFEIRCLTHEGTYHQVDDTCPLTWPQLAHFMVEVRNGEGMGFRRWVGGGEDKLYSTQPPFRAWLDWMIARGWAYGGVGDEVKLTTYGQCIFKDVCEGSFRYTTPPAQNNYDNHVIA